jgi:hypothetical protein
VKTIYFVNEALGCVDGYKINSLDDPLDGWTINATKTAGGTDIAQTAVTGPNPTGYFKFYLSLGTWNLSEVLPADWSAVTPASFSVPITKPFVCEHVRFKNRIDYACVDVYKLDLNGLVGLPGWQITITPGYGTSSQAQVSVTNGTGWVRFTHLTPGYYYFQEDLANHTGWHYGGANPPGADIAPGIELKASGKCQVVTLFNGQQTLIDP